MTVHRLTARALPMAGLAIGLLFAPPAQARSSSSGHKGLFSAEQTPLHITTTATKSHAATSSVGGSLLRTIVALVLVIGVIYAITWVLRRMRRSNEAKASGSGLASVATLPLGAGRSLHLVRAGGDLILVGASEHGVTPIRTYTEADARATGLLADDADIDLETLVPAAAVEWQPAPEWHHHGAATHAPGTVGYLIERLRRMTVRP